MRNHKKKNTGPRPLNGTGNVASNVASFNPSPSQTRYTFRYGYPDGVFVRREGSNLLSASSQNGQDSPQRYGHFRRRPVISTPRPARSIGSNALNLR